MFERDLTSTDMGTENILPIDTVEDTSNLSYEELRELCINTFKQVGRDDIVFDINMVDKPTRVRLINDEFYRKNVKAIRARSFKKQIDVLNDVITGKYVGDDTGDQSKNKLAAVSALNELMFQDINKADEDSKLNIEFISMTREDFEKDEKVEIHLGNGSAMDLSGGEEADKETKLKLEAKKLVKKVKKDEVN